MQLVGIQIYNLDIARIKKQYKEMKNIYHYLQSNIDKLRNNKDSKKNSLCAPATDRCCIVLEVGIVTCIKHFRWRYGTVRCPWGAILTLTATLRTIVTSTVSSTQRNSDLYIMCMLSIGSMRFNRHSGYNLRVFHDSL